MSRDLERATRLYRAFREAPVRRAQRVSLTLPKAVARIGVLEFVGYTTTHGSKLALYQHDFAPGSRPVIYSGPDRNQLILYGGRYHVTGAGITDLDSRGRAVDYAPRFVTVHRAEWLRYQRWLKAHRP